ncbi:MAG: DNA repair protein RecN [Coriobacteriales bacterium]|nr:DNA repair protein RecN [Coriobacteriales bacterium]
MLEELHVRDLALVEEAWLEFASGMTALTGETGAGKTALLGALKLLLGERADSGSVRPGAPETLVEGRFSIGGDEIIVSRRVTAEGRSRAKLDGSMASVGEIAERVGPLVDLHGRHEHQALLSVSSHQGYLDRWAGGVVADAIGEYRAALDAYREAVSERDALLARIGDATRRADYLRFVAEEIGRSDPQPGEDEAIEARLPALRHSERLLEGAHEAVEALRGEGGASDRLGAAMSALERLDGVDPALDAIADEVRAAATALDDAGQALRAYRDGVEADPVALDRAESRLAELTGLVKKYGPTLDDVLRARADAIAALDAVGEGEAGLERCEDAVRLAEDTLRGRAAALSAARRQAIPGFVEALTSAARGLAMDGASFEVAMTELPFEAWGPSGSDRAEFLYAPAPSTPARPLAKIASGGESSRVMLALKGVLGAADDVAVLVFDEVDAGIGGATAHAVGKRLAALARTHQVIVVTHLAQVAAYADRHLVVEKRLEDGRAHTLVRSVEDDERVAEIARMLSGGGSDASLQHAEELLSSALGTTECAG